MAVRAELGGWLLEGLAVTVRARDLADVLLMPDREPHLAPLRRNMLGRTWAIGEPARDEPGTTRDEREHDGREQGTHLHRAPS